MADLLADAKAAPVEAWITGIGLVSSLGEGPDAHWEALAERRVNIDATTHAPFIIHPLAPLNYDRQIPKKGDQRQMEAWQRIGTYAAGLALDSAGLKGQPDILSRTDMIVAAGGGERDLNVDGAIMAASAAGDSSPSLLNERLTSDLRPTLFLAQLSNLLAGNISIVHGVTGSSRTFMGEESAGIDAVRIALARIASGQSDIALVGAAHNADRKEMLMLYEFADFNLKGAHAPVWERGDKGGFALGSGGVFLVIESKAHAQARGAKPFARLSAVVADHVRREPGAVRACLDDMWRRIAPSSRHPAIISMATGAEPVTREERAFLSGHADVPARTISTQFGHLVEGQFPLAIALGALALSRREMFPPASPSPLEIETSAAPDQIVVVAAGHWRGEGMALLDAVET